MSKLFSRKLGVAIFYAGIVALNRKLGLGLTEDIILGLAGVASAYLLGQSYVDSRGGK